MTTPTRPKRAAKKGKPAGGYIGQAMRLAGKEKKIGVLGRMAEAQVRVIVREELATLKQRAETARANSVPSEPTEAEIEALAMVIYNASPMAGVPYSVHQDKAVKCARAALARAQPWPTYTPPLPAKVEGETSEPVASGEPVNPWKGDGSEWGDHYLKSGWDQAAAAWRSYAQSQSSKLRLALSQSQHEAEKAKGEIARLQSELAGVRGRMEAAEKVCGLFGEWDASRPANYSPAWYALKAAHSAWLSSRPLAPAEVKK